MPGGLDVTSWAICFQSSSYSYQSIEKFRIIIFAFFLPVAKHQFSGYIYTSIVCVDILFISWRNSSQLSLGTLEAFSASSLIDVEINSRIIIITKMLVLICCKDTSTLIIFDCPRTMHVIACLHRISSCETIILDRHAVYTALTKTIITGI